MSAKGYVVRGTAPGDVLHEEARDTLHAAVSTWTALVMNEAARPRIFAVAEDGTETPLLSYEEALVIVDHARRLIQSADLDSTNGERAGLSCDEAPYRALVQHFEAEREAARTIPGLVCAECDRPIYRGEQYAGKGGHAAHKACRNWPKGTTFKVAGDGEQQART